MVLVLVLDVGEVDGFQRYLTVSLTLGTNQTAMRRCGQEFGIFPLFDVVESRNLVCLPGMRWGCRFLS